MNTDLWNMDSGFSASPSPGMTKKGLSLRAKRSNLEPRSRLVERLLQIGEFKDVRATPAGALVDDATF